MLKRFLTVRILAIGIYPLLPKKDIVKMAVCLGPFSALLLFLCKWTDILFRNGCKQNSKATTAQVKLVRPGLINCLPLVFNHLLFVNLHCLGFCINQQVVRNSFGLVFRILGVAVFRGCAFRKYFHYQVRCKVKELFVMGLQTISRSGLNTVSLESL